VNEQMTQLKMQIKVTGTGQPMVLVPGGLTGWLSWDPHTERLSKTRKVIQVQLLSVQYGFENRSLPSDYSVKTESWALASSLDSLKITGPMDFVAWSFGALVTLDFALDNPGRIRSLVLIEPPANWVLHASGKEDIDLQQNEEMLRSLHGDISEEKLELFLCAIGFCPPGQVPRQLPQWPLWVQYRQALRNSLAILNHKDDLKRLREFNRPVLLVKGTGSAKFLHEIIDVLSTTLPNVQVVEMPAGHGPHIVSMDRFLDQMHRFQSKVQD
jgi:pimeloyl-ACP methyl ester carboxylesterase